MGSEKKPTLKILFRQFAISPHCHAGSGNYCPFWLGGLVVNAD